MKTLKEIMSASIVCTQMFIAGLFTKTPSQTQSRPPSTGKYMNTVEYVYTAESD